MPPSVRSLEDVRIAFGTDERMPLTDDIVEALRDLGHEVVVDVESEPWPDVGRRIGEAVAGGQADRGVVCCWTGTGVSIAANKVEGVRAALCTDAETARGARKWNDANVLALGLRLTSPTVAREVVEAFLTTDADPGEAETIARVS
jgi:ribose 5-phosphate isomerase B